MLPLSHRIAFAIFTLITLTLGARGFYRLGRRIARGRRDPDKRTDQPVRRLVYALRTTLFQERVFRRRRSLSVFHSFIFYAFVLYILVNAVDALDGYVHLNAAIAPTLLSVYNALADGFSVLAIIGVLAFVLRRFFFRSRRDFGFNERTLLHEKVRRGYIRQDSIIVSAFILFHVGSRIVANAARLAVEGTDPAQPFSSALAPLFSGPHALAWRIFGYWGALGSVLLFIAYFPYTKHIHLLAAPIKYFFGRHVPSGEMPPLELDLDAVEPRSGVSVLADLSQPRLLDAYACIQCNRCQDVCPASQTGKALSPSALEINKRMALNTITEEVSVFSLWGSAAFERGLSPGPALLEAVISPEAVWACTTCGACLEVCPTQDEPMLDILDLRRNLVMLQGDFPPQLQNAFRGMERASNPWAISRDKRMAWAEGLNVATVENNPDPDVLYWVGCAASYDPGAQKTARAVVQLLAEAHVNFAVLGKRECCTGDSARRAGNELLYQQLAGEAIAALSLARPRLVLASCPHCVNTIANEYPQLGGNFTVMHHTEYLAELVDQGQLKPLASESKVTFHDPCYLGRHRGTYEQPRAILHVLTNDYVELPRSKDNAFCCGAGGAQFWKEEEPGRERISDNRFREVQATLATEAEPSVLAVGCPFCKSMLQSTPGAGETPGIAIKDVAELLWEGVQRAKGIQPTLPPLQDAATQQTTVANLPSLPELAPAVSNKPADSPAPSPPLSTLEKIPERKKWTPKAAATPTNPETLVPAPDQVLAAEADGNAPPATAARPKWSPKPITTATTTDSASKNDQPAPSEPSDTGSAPARKKWQPGGPR